MLQLVFRSQTIGEAEYANFNKLKQLAVLCENEVLGLMSFRIFFT